MMRPDLRLPPSSDRPATGFTLVELMITVVILAVLLALAVPSMRELIARKRVEGVANELATDLRYLRSIQIERGGRRDIQMAVRFSTNTSMSCYVLFEKRTGSRDADCDCANQPACPDAVGASTELKTVTLPASNGVRLAAQPAELQLEGAGGLPVNGGTLSVSVSSSTGGELKVSTNPAARPSTCSVAGHGGFPACPPS